MRKKGPRIVHIPFNKPNISSNGLNYLSDAITNGALSGDGHFTQKCQLWCEERVLCQKALLTHSGTAALEMAAILADLKQGDEVIMPSYTFVSTANAFVLRGAIPVFVDIRTDTLNIDETLIEEAITERTKAIVPVHYAGVACEMNVIMEIASRYGLLVIEDAAHGVLSSYRDQALGSIGHLACFSFHGTKNITSGEGGALLINDSNLVSRAEIIREKGTNRSQFFRGQVDKYTWVDIGSSYLPAEIIAAFLFAQMEEADSITARRLEIWDIYHDAFSSFEADGRLRRPVVPKHCRHDAHMYYLLLRDVDDRASFIDAMKAHDINCVFHYVPLHNSTIGLKFGRTNGSLTVTETMADCLVRLPLWPALKDIQQKVIDSAVLCLK